MPPTFAAQGPPARTPNFPPEAVQLVSGVFGLWASPSQPHQTQNSPHSRCDAGRLTEPVDMSRRQPEPAWTAARIIGGLTDRIGEPYRGQRVAPSVSRRRASASNQESRLSSGRGSSRIGSARTGGSCDSEDHEVCDLNGTSQECPTSRADFAPSGGSTGIRADTPQPERPQARCRVEASAPVFGHSDSAFAY